MKLYAVRNKASGEWFKTHRGRVVWAEAGHAKNAWNVAQPWNSKLKFSTQDLWEVVSVIMVPEDDYKWMDEAAAAYEGLCK